MPSNQIKKKQGRRNPEHSTKFHKLVEQAKARYPHKNLKTNRWLYVLGEITRPNEKQWKEISPILEEINSKTSTLGLDSTPEERLEVRVYCAKRMLRIKLIAPLYYSTLISQDD